MEQLFHRFAHHVARICGSPYAFIVALAVVVLWMLSGPLFGYSDSWQLVINTGTTIVTFLLVFVIQSTQNRDALGLNLKLDELIRATKHARTTMIDLGKLSDKQLDQLEKEYLKLCAEPTPKHVH